MKRIAALLLFLSAAPCVASGQTAADSSAIVATSLNYIEGWYEGNSERMNAALHPELAKRIVFPGRNGGPDRFSHMTRDQLVQATGMGGGSRTPENERGIEVQILDIFENASVVRVDAADWVDYLEIARENGEWKIINVLWAMRPEAMERMGG